MKNVCDKYNRTIDSIRQLVSESRIHLLIDVTNSEQNYEIKTKNPAQLYPITQGYINKWLRQNAIIGNQYLIYTS